MAMLDSNLGDEEWSDARLLGLAEGETGSSTSKKGKGVEEDPMLWGVPGHLTLTEVAVYRKFAEYVSSSASKDGLSTIFCFGKEEGTVWALCRWLRARKYDYELVVQMIQEATTVRQDALSKDFYPNAVDALGCDSSLFFAQYPQLYTGNAKNGVPLFISKPGVLEVDGMDCITTLDGIIKFHWHIMMHDFADRLRAAKKNDPNFKRYDTMR
jgi:hypothetical protein